MSVAVKICGLRDAEALAAAIEGGVAYVGFVFYPPSKHVVDPTVATKLARMVPPQVTRVGLFVDPTEAELRAVMDQVSLDLLQLHGVETPERVAEIRARTGLPVMKALRMKTRAHQNVIPAYEAVADRMLYDSRIGDEPSGGPIDGSLLRGRVFTKPWMLAGGLTVANLAEAVVVSGATTVDVSSGVDDAPGHKSPAKIRAFLACAAAL